MGETLTLENLKAIYEAMSRVALIDQSEYYRNYYKEVEDRITELKELNKYRKDRNQCQK